MAKLFANSGDPEWVETVERRMWHLIWVCTVCQLPFYKFPDYNGLIKLLNMEQMMDMKYNVFFSQKTRKKKKKKK